MREFILLCILSTLATALNLTDKEQEYLAEHPTIKVGVDSNYPPFEYYKDGKFQGIAIDLLREIEHKLDVNFTLISAPNWTGVTKLAKEKKVDFLSCVTRTDQRAEYLNFTQAYLHFPMAIVTNQTAGYTNGLEDLKGKNVAVVNEYAESDTIEKYYKDIYLTQTNSLKKALELVSSGRTFAYVGNLAQVIYVSQQNGIRNLAISGVTKHNFNYSFGIVKKHTILEQILSKALQDIGQQKIDKMSCKWLPLHVKEFFIGYKTTLKMLAALTLLLAGYIYFIHGNMNKKNKKKRVQIFSQQEQINSLNSFLKLSKVGFFEIDLTKKRVTHAHNFPVHIDSQNTLLLSDFIVQYLNANSIELFTNKFDDFIVQKELSAQLSLQDKEKKAITIKLYKVEFDFFDNPMQIKCIVYF